MVMLLKLTRHAQKRIKERGVDIEHIRKALKDPDKKERLEEDKLKFIKKVRRKKLVVVCRKDGFKFKNQPEDVYIIISAYYL